MLLAIGAAKNSFNDNDFALVFFLPDFFPAALKKAQTYATLTSYFLCNILLVSSAIVTPCVSPVTCLIAHVPPFMNIVGANQNHMTSLQKDGR